MTIPREFTTSDPVRLHANTLATERRAQAMRAEVLRGIFAGTLRRFAAVLNSRAGSAEYSVSGNTPAHP